MNRYRYATVCTRENCEFSNPDAETDEELTMEKALAEAAEFNSSYNKWHRCNGVFVAMQLPVGEWEIIK